MRKSGFTLIELLIVIAIIAILALIAIPNFLEAQTRAKVSRAKADMRSIATAIEAYMIDQNMYLKCNSFSYGFSCPDGINNPPVFERLTTPIAYLSGQACFMDPFAPVTTRISWSAGAWAAPAAADPITNSYQWRANVTYKYYASGDNPSGGGSTAMWSTTIPATNWFVQGCGPARNYYNIGGALNAPLNSAQASATIYDPTNGTVSAGAIWRCGGQTKSGVDVFFAAVNKQQ
ncbi:MAG: prepilin-type N-terminal cleavage/methylation domain-containing protein [Candidatus Sumerlaeota bacterium]|nr:prepilin-type N-terminal cleavage/methylation domain-containing protein [Candidatus Sumerlaeota bacterium]